MPAGSINMAKGTGGCQKPTESKKVAYLATFARQVSTSNK